MNKKGFTLVEVLVTIVLISIISTIATISYSSILKQQNQKINEHTVKKIEDAALVYCTKNNCTSVTVEQLVKDNLLSKSNLVNQITKKQICNTAVVIINVSGYEATFDLDNATSC